MAPKIYIDIVTSKEEEAIKRQEIERQQQKELEAVQEATFDSWDKYKENIQPIPQGRKIGALMQALPLVSDNKKRQKLNDIRKEQFDKDLEANSDDANKQLDLWHEYIDWLEQNVPDGGKVNGITNAIEQCIELYYDKKEFKQDKRLFNIFMKFKRFCDEPIEIFGFMYANSICSLLARFYLNWSWQYEIKKNMKRAQDLIKLGLKNLATPRDVLVEAEAQLKCRIERMIRAGELDDCPQLGPMNTREAQEELRNCGIRAALQTLKFRVNKKKGSIKVPVKRIGNSVEQRNVGGLKSQSKIVNGVRVPNKTIAASTSIKSKQANAAIQVFRDEENQENGPEAADRLSRIMPKIATSQRIQMVGRRGTENQLPKSGTISKASS